MSTPEKGTPVRISDPDAEKVRVLSALYNESRGRFIGRAVYFYIQNHQEEIEEQKLQFFARLDKATDDLAAELAD